VVVVLTPSSNWTFIKHGNFNWVHGAIYCICIDKHNSSKEWTMWMLSTPWQVLSCWITEVSWGQEICLVPPVIPHQHWQLMPIEWHEGFGQISTFDPTLWQQKCILNCNSHQQPWQQKQQMITATRNTLKWNNSSSATGNDGNSNTVLGLCGENGGNLGLVWWCGTLLHVGLLWQQISQLLSWLLYSTHW